MTSRKHRMAMSAPMIRAIQRELWIGAGYGKTQTRRLMRPQPELWDTARHGPGQPNGELAYLWGWNAPDGWFIDEAHYDWPSALLQYAPTQPGDLLAFTETWAFGAGYDELPPREVPNSRYVRLWYQADVERRAPTQGCWRSSRFMPYWCSRYTGVVTDVRVERVREISQQDVFREGLANGDMKPEHSAQEAFAELWESLHGPEAWDRNDWVWVYTFRPIQAHVLDVERDPAAYGVGEVVA